MLKWLLALSSVFILLLLVTCKEMPTDPFDDLRNLKIDFFLEGNKVSAFSGDSILVGVTVNIPRLVKSLKVIDGEENNVRVLTLKNALANTPDTIFFKTLYKSPGSKIITVKAILTDNMTTDYPFEIVVLTPSNKVIFDTVPPKDTTVFDSKTTVFHIVSHTVPTSVIKYTLSSSPALTDSCFNIDGTGSALIHVIPPKPGVYGLKIAASNETVKDSFMMSMNVVAAPAVTVLSSNKVTHVGVTDTLTFTGSEKDSITLDNTGSYKSGEILVIATGLKNVIKIVFAPKESKVYTFHVRVKGVAADNNRYNDIVIVKDTVPGSELSVWKQDTLSISTAENSVISKSIDSLLANNLVTGVSFGCDKGTITQRLWSDTIRWGAPEFDTVVITASYQGNAYPLKMFIKTSASDVSLPNIVLVEPSSNDAMISSNVITCKFTITDSLSGVGSVVFRTGSAILSDTLHSGNIYLCTVKDLPKGVKTTITVDAIDRSQKRNAASKEISLIYNPDIQDNVAPVVSLRYPLSAEMRVLTDTATIQIECSDQSGIAAVTAIRAGVSLTSSIVNNGSLYSLKVDKLTAGKSDTVTFTVADSSTNNNTKSFPVVLHYNRKPSSITLASPIDASVGIDRKTTFAWSGGDDPDLDPVVYTVRYGTTETTLTKSIDAGNAKTVTLTTSLSALTKYYWQVVASTAVNNDSVVSDIWSYTTIEDAPLIMTDPQNQSVIVGNKATFSVTASGLNPKYQWYKGTTEISGATSATYTTPVVTSADNGTTYYCVVTNGGGKSTSASVVLTVMYGVVYDINGGKGTVPVDANAYAKDETVMVKAGTGLSMTGYFFAGWSRTKENSSKRYTSNDTLKMGTSNIILYALWNKLYSIIYNGNSQTSGSAPSSESFALGAQATISDNKGALTKTNYEFAGWNTSAAGSGTSYSIAQKVTMSSDLVLYAIWAPTNSVVYSSNGATRGSVPTDSKRYSIGSAVTVAGNSGSLEKTGYVFDGWSTTVNGEKVTSITMTSAVAILYARWVIKDASGNIYTEVKIGTQVWMVQNLRTTKFRDGTTIPLEGSTTTTTKARYETGNSITGALYNLYAVDTLPFIAPIGWHVATWSDWDTLVAFVKGDIQSISSNEYWMSSTNDSLGLSLVPEDAKPGIPVTRGTIGAYWMGESLGDYAGSDCGVVFYIESGSEVYHQAKHGASGTYMVRCIRDY